MLEIHNVTVHMMRHQDGGLLAYSKVEVGLNGGGTVVFGGLQIREGRNGLWVGWPGNKNQGTGTFYANDFFTNLEDRQEIEQAAIAEYTSKARIFRDPEPRERFQHDRPEREDLVDDDLPF